MNRIPRRLCRAAGAGLAVAAAVATAAAVEVPASAAAPASAAVAADDAAVRVIAKKLRSGPSQRSPQLIKRYVIDGKVFYYVAAPCCDQFNDLYDARGQRVCSPDGGISGHGDGRCPDIHVDPHEGGIVWRDAR